MLFDCANILVKTTLKKNKFWLDYSVVYTCGMATTVQLQGFLLRKVAIVMMEFSDRMDMPWRYQVLIVLPIFWLLNLFIKQHFMTISTSNNPTDNMFPRGTLVNTNWCIGSTPIFSNPNPKIIPLYVILTNFGCVLTRLLEGRRRRRLIRQRLIGNRGDSWTLWISHHHFFELWSLNGRRHGVVNQWEDILTSFIDFQRNRSLIIKHSDHTFAEINCGLQLLQGSTTDQKWGFSTYHRCWDYTSLSPQITGSKTTWLVVSVSPLP